MLLIIFWILGQVVLLFLVFFKKGRGRIASGHKLLFLHPGRLGLLPKHGAAASRSVLQIRCSLCAPCTALRLPRGRAGSQQQYQRCSHLSYARPRCFRCPFWPEIYRSPDPVRMALQFLRKIPQEIHGGQE